METSNKSVFEPCAITEELRNKLLSVLASKDQDFWSRKIYTLHSVVKIRGLNLTPSEEVMVVKGSSLITFGTHPQPEPFAQLVYVDNKGHAMMWLDFLLYERIRQVYQARLLANDPIALMHVAEIVGRINGPYFNTHQPTPILSQSHINALHQKFGTETSKDYYMKPEWLEAVHLPTLQVIDNSIVINLWAMPGEDRPIHTYNSITSSVAMWRLTVTIDDKKFEVKSRRIQHCYDDMMMERSNDNFMKNLNYKLFDAAFMHLVKRKFTGNELGYAPGDDKFKKYFPMKLNRHKNVTPESIRFLLNNCCVDTLDLSQIHSKMHYKLELSFNSKPTSLHCEKCFECVKVALADENSLKSINLNSIHIEHFNGLAVNTRITQLSILCTMRDLKFLNLFPNLESLSITNTRTPSDVSCIDKLTRLKRFELRNTSIAKEVRFEHLTGLVGLTLVDAWTSTEVVRQITPDIDNEGLDNIVSHLPNLEIISLTASRLTSLTSLGALKLLRQVDLSAFDRGECLTALTNITALRFKSTFPSDKHWIAIGRLTQLEELELSPYSDFNFEPHIAQLRKLRSLKLGRLPLSLSSISPTIERMNVSVKNIEPIITTFTNLKSLGLRVTGVISDQDNLFETIAKLTQLESLELSPLTNDGLGKLSTLVNLQEIIIQDQDKFNSEGAVHFKHFTKLQRVSFDNSPVSDIGLAHLTKLEHLEYISLKSSRTSSCISDEAIEFLENHRAYLEIVKE